MKKYYFTSESVTEGHPDKLCDTISDCILDAYIEQDKNSRVAVETFASGNDITIAGQVTSKGQVDIEKLVRNKIKEIGYDNANIDMDYRTCNIKINITRQSPDIALGVDVGGAGDQGMMFGFACDETPEYMPAPVMYSHALLRKATELRKNGKAPFLRPDSKSQVSVIYKDGKPVAIDSIVISHQHKPEATEEQIHDFLMDEVVKPVLEPTGMLTKDTKYYINPTGRFVIGGPAGDTGVTGRKIIVDTYGGMGRHGGGAFSGKDPSKVDRSAAYMARYVAKNLVANKLCSKCEIQFSYAIGVPDPISIFVDSFGTGVVSDQELEDIVRKNFDLTPGGIIQELDLLRPIYQSSDNYGHFGRTDVPWERIITLKK